MKVSNLAIGLFLVGFGLGLLAYGISLPPMPGQRYGAGLFPMLLGGAFAGFGGALTRQGWIERTVAGTALVRLEPWAKDRGLVINVLLILGMIVAYVLLSERIGFIVLSMAMLLLLFLRFEVPLLRSVIIAAVTTGFIHVAFVSLLRVPLPRGILAGLIW